MTTSAPRAVSLGSEETIFGKNILFHQIVTTLSSFLFKHDPVLAASNAVASAFLQGGITVENTSGGGPHAVVPPEIDRWNWGAFLLTWIWGIGNSTFIALLMFVPLVNFVMWFVLGAKGSAWAWRNKRWESVDEFKQTQRKWALWGVLVLVFAVLLGSGMFVAISSAMKNSGAYKVAVAELQGNPEVTQMLGTPIVTGFPMGNIQVSGPDGKASLSFKAEGPKGKGTVYVKAEEAMGQWHIDQAVFEDAASKRRIAIH